MHSSLFYDINSGLYFDFKVFLPILGQIWQNDVATSIFWWCVGGSISRRRELGKALLIILMSCIFRLPGLYGSAYNKLARRNTSKISSLCKKKFSVKLKPQKSYIEKCKHFKTLVCYNNKRLFLSPSVDFQRFFGYKEVCYNPAHMYLRSY